MQFLFIWAYCIDKLRYIWTFFKIGFGVLMVLKQIGFLNIINFIHWVFSSKKEKVMTQEVSFNKAAAFAPEVKAQLIAALKETDELKKFLLIVEDVSIKTFTDDNKQPWYKELMDIAIAISSTHGQAAIDAFSGITNIPTEWKAAPREVWFQFIFEFVVEEVKTIAAIWIKPTV